MSSLTTNLKLVKPELQDNITPTIFADNFDKIDAALEGVSGGALSLEEIEASTNLDGKIPSAAALKEVNNSFVSNIYVGSDGKLHKVQGGADSVLPFSSGNYYYRAFKGSDTVENRKDTLKVNTGVFFAYYNGSEFGRYEQGFAFCVKDGTVIVNRTQGSEDFTFSYSNGTLSLYSNERGYKCYGFYN